MTTEESFVRTISDELRNLMFSIFTEVNSQGYSILSKYMLKDKYAVPHTELKIGTFYSEELDGIDFRYFDIIRANKEDDTYSLFKVFATDSPQELWELLKECDSPWYYYKGEFVYPDMKNYNVLGDK